MEIIIRIRNEKGIIRPDMLQLMMENRDKKSKLDLIINDMVSQAIIFFFGDFDSISIVMCFYAYEIKINLSIQKRLQSEIDKVLKEINSQETYEAINNMEYLDAVINETLRLHLIAVITDRVCLKEFVLPPTLSETKPYIIKEGQVLWIPIYAFHYDPKYFEEAGKFDPERFLGERKRSSLNHGYLPFGLCPSMDNIRFVGDKDTALPSVGSCWDVVTWNAARRRHYRSSSPRTASI